MRNYYNQITNLPVLSRAEEKSLFEKAAQGDKLSQDKIINSNIKFVIKVANGYKNYGLPLEDVIQNGIEGLLIAFQKFDYTKNTKFITYAVWWIRQSIQKALYESAKAVRIPEHRSDLFFDSKYCSYSLDAAMDYENARESYINNFDDDYSSNFDERICEQDLLNHLMNGIENLPENERYVLNEYYGLSNNDAKPFRQIASEMNCSHETIRTYEKRAISKLRKIV